MAAYYNEIDPFAATWLRELIKAGQIADGEVDERSIELVRPDDLRGFRQCHFFAGIGGWSYALRLAGWPDDRPVWTGSCPCQPFSVAGKGDGFADERHLWPAWHWLIAQRRPIVVFGEQVESPAGRTWLDLVHTDLEGTGYACGPSNLPVAGVGAPGIRQRLFWVADTESNHGRGQQPEGTARSGWAGSSGVGAVSWMAESGCERLEGQRLRVFEGEPRHCSVEAWRDSEANGLADESRRGFGIDGRASWQPGHVDERGQTRRLDDGLITRLEGHGGDGRPGCESRRLDADTARSIAAAGATRGAWADADWLYCRDDKFRPVEPGTFPLAYGVSNRVGRLRGYGNAINPQVAAAFIEAYLDIPAQAGDQ